MSREREQRPPEGLEDVAAAYREAGFDDAPPAELDERILAAARRATKRGFDAYLPSLAMAATVLLALGIVLRLSVPEPETPGPAVEERPPAADPGGGAQRALMQERAAPLGADADDQAAGTADRAAPAQPDAEPAAAAGESAADGFATSPAARMRAPTDAATPCSAAQRGEPGLWLACIDTQIEAGAFDRAREELAAFRLAYPGYAVPAGLAETLEP